MAIALVPSWATSKEGPAVYSLNDALADTYTSAPQILRERALLRQTDEGVPRALSGWRPTISVGASANYNQSSYVTYPFGGSFRYDEQFAAPGYSAGVTISQPLFTGGKTVASTRQAMHTVLQERARLVMVEQQVFQSAVSAYVSLSQARSLLDLAKQNEATLAGQVHLTTSQFGLRQATETDVLQARSQYEAARAASRQAESDLGVAEASFQRMVGIAAPDRIEPPQPLVLPVKTEADADQLASVDYPPVMGAQYTLAARRDAVKVAFAALLPQISAQASFQRQINQDEAKFTEDAEMATIQASIPLYQGGSEYAAIRAARHAVDAARHDLDDQKRIAAQTADSAWRKLQADRDQLVRNRAAVSLGEAALHAIQQQELLGVRTTFEVLQQQQLLFQQQKTLIQNVANTVADSYAVAASIGRLTAHDLRLDAPIYDPAAHLKAVKWKMIGTE
ncbi:TolC family outer membrane protein [Gluconacetobacter diazotrophicus]|uniref:TolC family outer membrane protein n=1 Tax=Gluconacetobacter diazotrophicus TaxID=33996 RepID=A0A7W4I8A3_GLUDI|nr:TolC family outer membrane protein [Gluconacetobacter diazotrophicus]MBB2158133.1 TolC family outer membrane protein [Gluconacetobacter diazotrophicus]